jgi:outer membrane protein assembly factor BamB
MSQHRAIARRALLHPFWAAALTLLLLNDHVLKGAGLLPPWLTGKLSDFAGMIVAPVLLAALIGARRRRSIAGCFVAVGASFALINVWPSASQFCEWIMPWRLWPDPTDLLALPMLWVAWRALLPCMQDAPLEHSWRRAAEALGIGVGAFACLATSFASTTPLIVVPGGVLAQAFSRYPVNVVDAATGRVTAQLELDGFSSDQVVHDGVLYAVSPRRVRALHVDSGKLLFEHVAEGRTFQRRLFSDGARIYVMSAPSSTHASEHVMAIDAKTGALAWDTALASDKSWRGDGDTHVFGGGLVLVPVGKEIVAIDPFGGKHVWHYRAGVQLRHLTVGGSAAYAATKDGVIHAIDLRHGTAKWRFNAGGALGSNDRWHSNAVLNVAGDKLVFLRDGHIVAIDATTSNLRWQTEHSVMDVVVGDTVAIALLPDDHHLAAYDTRDGRQRWRIVTDHGYAGTPVIAEQEGLVLVRHYTAELFAYETASGRLRWKVDLLDGERRLEVSKRVVMGSRAF